MRTLSEIQTKIDNISSNEKNPKLSTKERRRMKKELDMLTNVKYYLEFNPSESFIVSEHDRVTEAIDKFENGFGTWLNSTPGAKSLKNPESKYYKVTGVTSMRKQLNTLKFILNRGK